MRAVLRHVVQLGVLVMIIAGSLAVGMALRGIVDARKPRSLRLSQLTDSRVSGAGSEVNGGQTDLTDDPTETFRDVIEMVRSEYVEKVEDTSRLSAGAVRTMLYALDDPSARYWNQEQYALLERRLQGEHSGIGAVLAIAKIKRNEIEQRRLVVVAPVPGGPAAQAGIRAGDYITEVNDRWVIAYDPRLDLNRLALRTMPDTEYRKIMREATKKLTDGISWPRALETLTQPKDKDKEIKLTLERPGTAQPIKVTVKPGMVRPGLVHYRRLPGEIGYLKVVQFAPTTPQLIQEALADRGKLAGLILDLRDNPGGPDADGPASVVRAMVEALNAVGIRGEIGSIVKGPSKRSLRTGGNGPQAPRMAVLTNKGTANVAEVAAEACRVLHGAVLVGGSTRGDGIYQRLIPLRVGGLTLPAGRWITASGKPIPVTGLQPAEAVAGSAQDREQDPVIARAAAILANRKGRA